MTTNTIAREGVDRCPCGAKYWEGDRCVDCGTHVTLLALVTRAGVRGLDLYADGIEVVGSEDDQDDSQGIVPSTITPEALRLAFPHLHVTDCRWEALR